MDSYHPTAEPISFFRHAKAVLGAALVAATALALATGLLAVEQFRDPAAGVLIAMRTWLHVYIAVIPLGGLLFSLAYPVTRTGRASGQPISALIGAIGAITMTWATNATTGDATGPGQIVMAMTIGAMIGCAYWEFARRHQ